MAVILGILLAGAIGLTGTSEASAVDARNNPPATPTPTASDERTLINFKRALLLARCHLDGTDQYACELKDAGADVLRNIPVPRFNVRFP